ncbi:MAG: DUF819 domain-containing protein [Flavobacteriales bacterium]
MKKLFSIFLLTHFLILSAQQSIYFSTPEKPIVSGEKYTQKIKIDSMLYFTELNLQLEYKSDFVTISGFHFNKKINKNTLRYTFQNNRINIQYQGDLVSLEDTPVLFSLDVIPKKEIKKSTIFNLSGTIQSKQDYQFKESKITIKKVPLFTDDVIVFGLLMLCLAFVFYTSSLNSPAWKKFYTLAPALLMCYLLPAVLNSLNIISSDVSKLYTMAKNYLLPASLILLTLSIDVKGLINLGWRPVAMFLTGTLGIIIGGPLSILIVSIFWPDAVGGIGYDAVWRGLSTLAGSWIGGGANQAAMLEIYGYNQEKYGAMVLVDIVVANIWMAFLLFGIGKKDRIDKWLKADSSAIDELQRKVENYSAGITKTATLKDLIIMGGIAFLSVAFSHYFADIISSFLKENSKAVSDPTSYVNSFGSKFFWMIVLTTVIGLVMSLTSLRKFEGVGASKIGSVFIYILVATIGMKMDIFAIFQKENLGLFLVGIIWMIIHVALLFFVAKLICAPYFFLAVGSKANVGGAASAPVVAAAFSPSLAPVGVILAVFGYALGTFGAMLCTILMQLASS